MTIKVSTLDGGTVTITGDTLAALRGQVRGQVVLPGEGGYDAARTVWNSMIDRRPRWSCARSARATSAPRSFSRGRWAR